MKAYEVLVAARELISDPARWTQGVGARDTDGEGVNSLSEHAVCWCSIGATYKVTDARVNDYQRANDVLDAVANDRGYMDVIKFNDTRSHSEVLALWDGAIAYAKENNL